MAITDSCWYLNGEIGDLQISFLLDSGSNSNILSGKIFDSLGPEIKGPLKMSKVRLFGASGTELRVLGEATLTLSAGKQQMEVPFLIADLPRSTGILGMGFLSTKTSSLDLSNGILTLNEEPIALFKPNVMFYLAEKGDEGEGEQIEGSEVNMVKCNLSSKINSGSDHEHISDSD